MALTVLRHAARPLRCDGQTRFIVRGFPTASKDILQDVVLRHDGAVFLCPVEAPLSKESVRNFTEHDSSHDELLVFRVAAQCKWRNRDFQTNLSRFHLKAEVMVLHRWYLECRESDADANRLPIRREPASASAEPKIDGRCDLSAVQGGQQPSG
ncbi:hypothetical protein JX265_011114 [Neoarthrinium moseri]|uniref:Uncharacterized protein n=2 Tax=Neoarthrinium moseri TaxID=1658444 RepID=A0A9Q0AK02_9PEZI|nr:hypothetical protein JX265_011114 [Neoarthrinium moseri]